MVPWEEEKNRRGNYKEEVLNAPFVGGANYGRLSQGEESEMEGVGLGGDSQKKV